MERVEHPDLASRVLERVRALDGGTGGGRGDAVAVRPQNGAAVRLEEVPDLGVDGVLGIHAAFVGGEHVRVRLRPPLGAVVVGARDRHALLVRVLGREEHQRALRHDAERLRVGLLDGRRDLRRAGLVVEYQRDQLVPVHAALGVLHGDAGLEPCGRGRVLGPALPRQVSDVRNGDGRRRCGRLRGGQGDGQQAGRPRHQRSSKPSDCDRVSHFTLPLSLSGTLLPPM